MRNPIRQAQDLIDNFHQHLKDIFFDEYPAQLAQDNPEEYQRLLNDYLDNYTRPRADAVFN